MFIPESTGTWRTLKPLGAEMIVEIYFGMELELLFEESPLVSLYGSQRDTLIFAIEYSHKLEWSDCLYYISSHSGHFIISAIVITKQF